jgi:hypothetical protein
MDLEDVKLYIESSIVEDFLIGCCSQWVVMEFWDLIWWRINVVCVTGTTPPAILYQGLTIKTSPLEVRKQPNLLNYMCQNKMLKKKIRK